MKMNDPYCYPNTDVLINKLDIKSKDDLDNTEIAYVCNRLYELSINGLEGDYTLEHFLGIHAYIFQDIYVWAGEIRTIDIEKEEEILGYLSIEYEKHNNIKTALNKALLDLKNRDWKQFSMEELVEQLAYDIATIWKIHPFREGNTRVVITFLCQFIEYIGFKVDRTLFQEHPIYVRNALVAATAIFSEGDFRKWEYLQKVIRNSIIEPIELQ